jgi:HemX protein
MIHALHLAALAVYLIAAAIFLLSLRQADPRLPARGSLLAAGGAVLHLAALAAFHRQWGELPLVGIGPVLSSLALLIVAGALTAAALSRATALGLIPVPAAALLVFAALLLGVRPGGEPTTFQGPWFTLHVLLAALGYVGLTVAFAASLMYLLQFKQLKRKRFGAIFRVFPPLETLDRLGERALLAGFPFLTLALVVGWAWLVRFETAPTPGNPHLAWGVLSWLVFLAALAARRLPHGGARGGALMTVIGFALVVAAYVVLRAPAAGRAFL